ncbi:MAG: tyrosine-type recombinase/integrase, partial [Synergistaceae bacterium]|nr:tyrosine-type recombinase/integrase [Synergistaceae bacterium]
MPLSETQLRRIKPKEKSFMIRDSENLWLEVTPKGAKYWRLRYSTQGKEVKISLGVYPWITLKEARGKRDAFKHDLANGIDPRAPVKLPATFEQVAREWHAKHVVGKKTAKRAQDVMSWLEHYLFPYLGNHPIREIKAPELLAALRLVEARGIIVTAHSVRQVAGMVFRYGVAVGECEHDITADLRGALPPIDTDKHRASLTRPEDIAGLMRAIDSFKGSYIVGRALWFSAYSMLRPGEVRRLEWAEVNFESQEILIPKEKMKMRRPHIVPMSNQIVEILHQLKPLTGHGQYVFPSIRSAAGIVPMSDDTILAALRRLGYGKDEMSAHGFRSMASTVLNEQRWPRDAIERQLAHAEGNKVKAAYDHA